jgi:hypothetical protein
MNNDMKNASVGNWRREAKDRVGWGRIPEEPKAHSGL